MHSVDFCDACIEGLWQSLLRPLSLIDGVTQVARDDGRRNVTLELLPLAEFRQIATSKAESYTVTWYGADGETVVDEWANQTSVVAGRCVKSLEVEVRFDTEQVRVDSGGVMVRRERIDLE